MRLDLSPSKVPNCDFEVGLWGTVFLDIIFTGLDAPPEPGTEVQASGMGSCPGGIANLALAAARLGLRTTLAAAFAEDNYADFCWETLASEGVDLSGSRRYLDWHTPVTVSLALAQDRSMVTHAHPPGGYTRDPVSPPPAARAVIADLGAAETQTAIGQQWFAETAAQGSLIFADLGWDSTQEWQPELLAPLSHCHAFTPNAVEAMRYTRTDSPQEALYALADLVPLAVVTNGPHGALGIDSGSGEQELVPGLRVPALDPTGAGDVFAAALLLGTLAGWSLAQRLAFGTLCSGLAVQQFGGSLAAPGWGDIAEWWHQLRDNPSGDAYVTTTRRRYEFLEDIVPVVPAGARHRATATIARRADLG